MVDVERTFESFGYLENIVEEGVDGKQYHEYLQSRLFSPTNTYDDDDDDDDDDDERSLRPLSNSSSESSFSSFYLDDRSSSANSGTYSRYSSSHTV